MSVAKAKAEAEAEAKKVIYFIWFRHNEFWHTLFLTHIYFRKNNLFGIQVWVILIVSNIQEESNLSQKKTII
jgi:hypothetical protein